VVVALQAPNAGSSTNYNLVSINSGGQDVFAIRGDGMTTVFQDLTIGTSLSDQLTIRATIQGSIPFVLEGGCVLSDMLGCGRTFTASVMPQVH
jgi:hypothetical protein